jgi:hypothetical protein
MERRKLDATELRTELTKNGGEWIGRAREWMQWNIRGGDVLPWSSTEAVSVSFCDLQELAREAAIGALLDHQAREDAIASLRDKLLRSQMECERLRSELNAQQGPILASDLVPQ